MALLRRIIGGLRALFRKRRSELELDEELSSYIEMAAADKMKRGANLSEALRAVRLEIGGRDAIKEETREVGWESRLETFCLDIRYAVRVLAKHRTFTCVALFALTLGIGATTAVYSIVDATVLQPLPFREPDRLYSIIIKTANGGTGGIYREEMQGWIEQSRCFDAVVTYGPVQKKLTGGGEPELLGGKSVPANFFSMLGVKPMIGRTFSHEEDRPEATPVVVLGHGVWQRSFGGDPTILGRFISLDNQPHMVIGVMPPGFGFPVPSETAGIWVPVHQDHNVSEWGTRGLLRVYCRIKPGVTVQQASFDLNHVCAGLAREIPEIFAGRTATLIPLHQSVTGTPGRLPMIVLGAVAFVLLIAITNVANLMLGHASSRGKEIAVRLSIGAGRWRIVRQLLTESLLLSLTGGILGLVCAWMILGYLRALLPENVPRAGDIGINWRVAIFAVCISVAAGVLFGLFPSLVASKRNLAGSLNQGRQQHLGQLRGRGARGVLTIAEVTLATVLCIGAGLLLKSFAAMLAVDLGIRPQNVVAFHLPLPIASMNPQIRDPYDRELIRSVSALPGVTHVAVSTELPLKSAVAGFGTTVFTDQDPSPRNKGYLVKAWMVTPDYFQTVGSRLLRGRFFSENDLRDNSQVLVVSEDAAGTFWPGQDALGKSLLSFRTRGAQVTKVPFEIIGVVKDVKKDESQIPVPWREHVLYFPLSVEERVPPENHILLVRTANDPRLVISALRRAIWSVDKNQPIKNVFLMGDVIYHELDAPRFRGFLVGFFAAIALVIAAIGIYGMVSHSVATRLHEMGVRIALGARRADLLRLVIGEGLVLVVSGIILGTAGSLALTRTIRSFLFEVRPIDSSTYILVAALFVIVGFGACWLPAWRASKADPLAVLRCE